jgi:hypothetical protein
MIQIAGGVIPSILLIDKARGQQIRNFKKKSPSGRRNKQKKGGHGESWREDVASRGSFESLHMRQSN